MNINNATIYNIRTKALMFAKIAFWMTALFVFAAVNALIYEMLVPY